MIKTEMVINKAIAAVNMRNQLSKGMEAVKDEAVIDAVVTDAADDNKRITPYSDDYAGDEKAVVYG